MPSRAEGGASALSEALACGLPVLASRVRGNVGILGARHPGLFPSADAAALARLLRRFETEPAFRRRLEAATSRIAPAVSPRTESAAWAALLRELGLG